MIPLRGQQSLPFDRTENADAGPPCSSPGCGGATVVKSGSYGPPIAVCLKCGVGSDLPRRSRARRGGKPA